MKKLKLLLPIIVSFFFFACSEDNSIYEPQQKENITIDKVENEDQDEEEELPEGQLVPGFHTVKLQVTQPDGQIVERRFKYYMPIAAYGNPSLIFEFHGSWEYQKKGAIPDPIKYIGVSDPLAQLAIQKNCIVCYPAGGVDESSSDTAYINWRESENHLPFFDAMVNYFKGCTPTIDENRIYSTGQSSGAIFSWVLAFERPEVVASIAPRAGRMNTDNETNFPNRCVPVRVFAGEDDKTVIHSGLVSDVTNWAERIGGYFGNGVVIDTFSIPDYAHVTTRKWNGAKGDIEIYSLKGIGHGVSLKECCPYMWEFLDVHTLDANPENLFISSEIDSIRTDCGKTIDFKINFTEGAQLNFTEPKGWKITVNGKNVSIAVPQNYFAAIAREGEIKFTASLNGQETSTGIYFKITEPRSYLKVGDIYYNENFEPIGVVVWVNQDNIREGKIISPKKPGQYGSIWYCGNGEGLGLDFQTPDRGNGYQNTQDMLARNNTFAKPYTADDAAFVWASEYSVAGEKGWYFPAIEELAVANSNLAIINEALKSMGGDVLNGNVYSSTTKVENGSQKKTFYYYNFNTGTEVTYLPRDNNSEYLGYIVARAMKVVTKN